MYLWKTVLVPQQHGCLHTLLHIVQGRKMIVLSPNPRQHPLSPNLFRRKQHPIRELCQCHSSILMLLLRIVNQISLRLALVQLALNHAIIILRTPSIPTRCISEFHFFPHVVYISQFQTIALLYHLIYMSPHLYLHTCELFAFFLLIIVLMTCCTQK